MAIGCYVDHFTKANATGNQDISLPSGTVTAMNAGPYAIIMWAGGSDQVSGTWDNNIRAGISYIAVDSGTTQYAVSVASGTGNAVGDTERRIANKALALVYEDASIAAEATFSGLPDSTHMRLNYTTAAASDSININYMIITGLTHATVVAWTLPATATTKSVTDPNFLPDLVFHAGVAQTSLPSSSTGAFLHQGWMNKHGQQASNAVVMADGVTANTSRGQQTDAMTIVTNTDSEYDDFKFVSMDSVGFTVRTSGTSSSQYVISLCMSGISSKIGSFSKTSTTSAVAQSIYTKQGFTPRGGIFSWYGQAASSSPFVSAVWGMGASDGTNQRAASISDVDAVNPTRSKSVWVSGSSIAIGYDTGDYGTTGVVFTDTDNIALSWSAAAAAVASEIVHCILGDSGTNTYPSTVGV